MKKNITSVVTLVAICAIISVLMALTNYITAPIIKANDEAAANAALREVLPDGTGFKKIENFAETYEGIPKSVTEISAAENGGYAVTVTVNGYGAGMKVMIGVNADGTVVGAKCLDKGGETKGEENTYGEKTLGATLDSVDALDTVAGATMTTNAYKNAVKAALQTAAILADPEGGDKS